MPQAFDPSAVRSGSVFSDNPNYNAIWVCYVNGIEVPILGFDITTGVWQPPQFEIYMLPDVSIQRLGHEDRVPVQIFYMDYWNVPERPELRLLVDGEIRGYRSKKVMGQRAISFSCMSHINIFEKLYFFFMNTVDDIVASQSPEIRTQGFTGQGLFYPYSLFHQGLFVNQGTGNDAEVQRTTTETDQPQGDVVKTAHEIHYNVIKGIIGSSSSVPGLSDEKRSLPMMNFFSRHTRKTRLHQRFVRLPLMEDVATVNDRKGVFPIFAAVRADEALTAMQHQVAGRVGNSGSIWDMLKQIYGIVYMEFACIPNPTAVHTNLEGEILGPVTANDPLIQQIALGANPAPVAATTTTTAAATSATENVAANNLQAAQADEARALAASRALGGYALFDSARNERVGAAFAALGAAQQRRAAAERALAAARSSARPASTTTTTPAGPLIANGQSQTSDSEVRDGVQTNAPIGSDPARPIRLAQYFAKPQFLFGIPPHCNVFFPSQIDDLSYAEDYAEQPTRVYVNDSVMGNVLRSSGTNREFMIHALTVAYPEEADAVMHSNTPDANTPTGTLHETGKNLLIWPEEFYKGPVTAKIELPSWFQTMMQFLNAREGGGDSGSGGTAPAAAVNGAPPAGATTPIGNGPVPRVTIPMNATTSSVPGSGRSYRNGLPSAFANEYSRRIASRWNGEIGAAIRRMVPVIFGPNALPELFLGFSVGANIYENTTTARANQPFHELGLFGVEGGLRAGPAPNPDPRAPYSNWARHASSDLVRRAIGAVEGRERSASLAPGGWTALNDQIAVGLMNLRGHLQGVARILTARGVPTAVDDSQWSMIVMMMAWSAGSTGAANAVTHASMKAAVGAAPTSSRWGTAVRLLAEAGAAGTIQPIQAHAHNINKFYTMVRTLQKVEAARVLAQQTGHASWFDDGLGGNRQQYHDVIARLAYVPQPGQVPQRGRANPLVPSIQTHDPTENVGAATREVTAPTATTTVRRETTGTALPGATALPGTANRGPADRAPTATVTTTAPEDSAEAELPANQKFADLFRLYAQYEYSRQRYMQKNGSTALRFNPYVVAGFPCMAFDRATTSEHVVGYVYTVNQRASGKSISTSVGMTCVRTFPEFLNDVRNDCERFSERITAAPAEMIPEVRHVIQNEEQAEIFYQRLFYGTARPGNLPAAFHFDRALGYTRGLDVEEISITATSTVNDTQEPAPDAPSRTPAQQSAVDQAQRTYDAARAEDGSPSLNETGYARERRLARLAEARAAYDAVVSANAPPPAPSAPPLERTTTNTVTHNLDPNEALSPLPNTIYTDAFDSYDVAMQLAARNVCTLTEFIRFWHGGRALGDLISSGEVEGVEDTYNYGSVVERDVIAEGQPEGGQRQVTVGQATRYTATYYRRIFKLRQGPGRPPTEQERGYTEGATPSGTTSGVPADYPETRADWDSILLAYRQKARSRLSPST